MILHRKKKLDIIAHSLTKSGIPLWKGIPEAILEDLKANGYVIKKKKLIEWEMKLWRNKN